MGATKTQNFSGPIVLIDRSFTAVHYRNDTIHIDSLIDRIPTV